jgi:signal transduction histidine kinase
MSQTHRRSESARLAALHKYQILDSDPESAFDELAELASVLFSAPIAVINFIDSERQWFKSEIGLGVRETPLETSFCVHAVLQEDMMVVPDTRKDKRFADNPLVTAELGLRFYAGALLKSHDGFPLGTLCILDYKPRDFDQSQQHTLRVLANQVMAQLEQKRLLQESEASRAELATLNRKLLEHDRSKDEFLAMISHELRTPLSSIMMTLDILKLKGIAIQGTAKHLGTISRQADHLVRLVDDLLDASRITTGKISLEKKPLLLDSIITRSSEMVAAALNEKQHDLTVKLPEQPVQLDADEIRICQVFSNLLSNAIRYTPPNGEIHVEAKLTDQSELQISVSDTGAGIPSDYLERIFDSFVQAPQAEGRSGGLGIGLHLCRRIVHMHDGSIFATSDGEGMGSRFTVCLPVIEASHNNICGT